MKKLLQLFVVVCWFGFASLAAKELIPAGEIAQVNSSGETIARDPELAVGAEGEFIVVWQATVGTLAGQRLEGEQNLPVAEAQVAEDLRLLLGAGPRPVVFPTTPPLLRSPSIRRMRFLSGERTFRGLRSAPCGEVDDGGLRAAVAVCGYFVGQTAGPPSMLWALRRLSTKGGYPGKTG